MPGIPGTGIAGTGMTLGFMDPGVMTPGITGPIITIGDIVLTGGMVLVPITVPASARITTAGFTGTQTVLQE